MTDGKLRLKHPKSVRCICGEPESTQIKWFINQNLLFFYFHVSAEQLWGLTFSQSIWVDRKVLPLMTLETANSLAYKAQPFRSPGYVQAYQGTLCASPYELSRSSTYLLFTIIPVSLGLVAQVVISKWFSHYITFFGGQNSLRNQLRPF